MGCSKNSSKRVLNNPLSTVDKKSKQKMNKKIEDLNNTINQIDVTDILSTIQDQQQNTLSSQVLMEHSPE